MINRITPEAEEGYGGELPDWIKVEKAKDQTSQTLINSLTQIEKTDFRLSKKLTEHVLTLANEK